MVSRIYAHRRASGHGTELSKTLRLTFALPCT